MSSKTILVVDDEPDMLASLYSRLKGCGYHVITADNGREGIQLASMGNPNLIITDIKMPGMNGHEMISEIRQTSSAKNIPVIFLTAHPDFADMKRVIQNERDRYIAKPVDQDLLLCTVEALMNS